jgi:bifunctional polynucleotide phosphatase/kinase
VSKKVEEIGSLKLDVFFKDPQDEFIYWCHPGFTTEHIASATKMVCFDMDGCVIDTKSGAKFATDYITDWRLWHTEAVAEKFRELYEEGAYLCLISNQSGVANKKVKWTDIEPKVRAIVQALGVPVDFICCPAESGTSVFRKPNIGAWQFMQHHRCPNAVHSESCYVGDAAGRPAQGKLRKKDFADSDYKLALNLGVTFYTPERYFLGDMSPYHNNLPVPDPSTSKLCYGGGDHNMMASGGGGSGCAVIPDEVYNPPGSGTGTEIVLLVGPAGTGKSTFARTLQAKAKGMVRYSIVTQDELGSRNACKAAAERTLSCGGSVIVANTNLDVNVRNEWVRLAGSVGMIAEGGCRIRCVVLTTSKDTAMLQTCYRMLSPSTPAVDRRQVHRIAIHSHYKTLRENPPVMREGFYRIDEVPWVPVEPSDQVDKLLCTMYLK